jgi:four helix bundle protein
MERRGEELEDRLLDFAARVGKVVDALPDTRLGRHVAGQLVRSGTSPAPNYAEACAAESKRDFIHKLEIALKELRESRSWIKLIVKAEMLPESRMAPLLDEAQQLCNIVGKSIVTAKANQEQTDPQNILHFAVFILAFPMLLATRPRELPHADLHGSGLSGLGKLVR